MSILSYQEQEVHKRFMRVALLYARRGLGKTAPNPSVGCVIVSGHKIVGVSSTAIGGRPHAEVGAVAMAGAQAKDATAYVTLEPCCHEGKSGACTKALIDAGVARVVVAVRDPFKAVAGKGIQALKSAGIEVVEGVCEDEAAWINRGFFKVQADNRPLVTLKTATSLDGKIALHNGESQWITSEESRRHAHLLRAQHDALITGVGTAIADNPLLNCRIAGLEHCSPIRIVLDSQLSLPLTSQLVETARETPLWLMTTSDNKNIHQNYEEKGVVIVRIKSDKYGHIRLIDALEYCANNGLTRVLVEAGMAVSTAFLRQGLVDDAILYQAPKIIGSDGMAAFDKMHLESVNLLMQWHEYSMRRFGSDVMRHLTLLN